MTKTLTGYAVKGKWFNAFTCHYWLKNMRAQKKIGNVFPPLLFIVC